MSINLKKSQSRFDPEHIRNFIRRNGDKFGPDFNTTVQKYIFLYNNEPAKSEFYYVFLAEFLTIWGTPYTYDVGVFTVGTTGSTMEITNPDKLSMVYNLALEHTVWFSAGWVSPDRLVGSRPWSYQYDQSEYQLFVLKYREEAVEGIIEIVTTDLPAMYRIKKDLFNMAVSGSGLNNMNTLCMMVYNNELTPADIISYFEKLNLPGLKSIKLANLSQSYACARTRV